MTPLADLPPADRHRAIAAAFTENVALVHDWDLPTPVEGWVVRDIVAHLVNWFTDFLSAGGQELPPGPDTQSDPAAAWQAHVEGVQALLAEATDESEFSHPMVGTHRLADAIDQFYTSDIFMHTWDLATAIGRSPNLDPAFAAQLLDGMAGIEDLLRSSGQYGPAVAVAADADPVTRLAGFIGRDPKWPNISLPGR
ncbi:TIGR03086 family metal-binding protein [Rhodococcus sp. H29-C3]|uniref:TIGR03086 family metal-binding protein n=1 Tax=Rhodococcus sp. H29-C3 TaxID=3046307 RepID=UPI0024BA7CF7|nr:TIGR03086 family metal-binding protein [Rhodococcus sp. H29-C3]MDJ0362032.1 TIGR03086 family metal-binding protein [Rhodococcus sp. H29-C3]